MASGGHSSSRCAGLSLSRPLLLRSTGSRHAGSVLVAQGPSRSAACGILPDQGLNPRPLHYQADSQPLRHQGSPSIFYVTCKCHRLYEFASPGFEATKHLGRIGSLKGRHSEAPVEGKTKTCTSSVLKIADIKQRLVCARPCTVLHGLSPSILINPFFR